MALREKKVIIKVYNSDGTFNTTWNDQVKKVQYSWSVNGGLSSLNLRLARPTDNFGEDDDVKLYNVIKVYIRDRDTTGEGLKIYEGYLANYRPFKGARDEYIDIEVYSYVTELSDKILKDANDKTTLNYLSEDPSDILISIMKNYARDGGSLYYTDDTIDTTSTTVSYEYKLQTYFEAVNKVVEICPYRWFWYQGRDNNVYLKEADFDVVDHDLKLGKQVKSISPFKRGESIYNTVFFVGDGVYKKYERTGSINEYGSLEKKISDMRVTVEATANVMAERFLDEYDHPELTFDVEVVDNNGTTTQGYDIESLKPGDIVKVQHPHYETQESLWDVMEWDVDYWDFNIKYALGLPMIIRNIRYAFDTATITCSTRFPEVSKRIEDINRNLVNKINEDVGDTPTT